MSMNATDRGQTIDVVGRGKLGSALAPALRAAGFVVRGPFGRTDWRELAAEGAVVVLCIPDGAIADVAREIPPGAIVAHCAGSLTLDVLGDREAFSIHPLLAAHGEGTMFAGAACAIAASSERARTIAMTIATALGMDPVQVDDADRALYHAAASMASNYLVTIEDAAERLAERTGIRRQHLARLAASALETWTTAGGRAALTGPVVRGDEQTVARQRGAVERAEPAQLPLWDALTDATRRLARRDMRER